MHSKSGLTTTLQDKGGMFLEVSQEEEGRLSSAGSFLSIEKGHDSIKTR